MKMETMPATGAQEVVESLCQAYATAVNASDSDAYSKLFAQDAIRMPPGDRWSMGRSRFERVSRRTTTSQHSRSGPRPAMCSA